MKMNLDDFKKFIKSQAPKIIAEELILKKSIHAFKSEADYSNYLNIIRQDHQGAYLIAIVGSANWKFSLNPDKNLSEYHIKSDIDVAIICAEHYLQTWDELRLFHRDQYYSLGQDARHSLRRNGENVYSGFVSPKWVPSLKSKLRQRHEKLTNKYSNASVGYRAVNMMYFRNMDETIDYYVRGIRAAKK
ncbi:hypothetical protein ACLEJQ_16835 [Pseudomonas sp. SMV71]|uniref:hypothetical protein n=1 Tax=Pseudomonas sp. SMV71 TaxID=3390195 RepID=UPI003F86B46D